MIFHRCVISAICYILVVVGLQIGNRSGTFFSKLKPMKKPWFYQFQFPRGIFLPIKKCLVFTVFHFKEVFFVISVKDFQRSLLLPGVFVSLGNIVICLLQVLKPTKYKITLNICFVKSFHCMYDMTYCCSKLNS